MAKKIYIRDISGCPALRTVLATIHTKNPGTQPKLSLSDLARQNMPRKATMFQQAIVGVGVRLADPMEGFREVDRDALVRKLAGELPMTAVKAAAGVLGDARGVKEGFEDVLDMLGATSEDEEAIETAESFLERAKAARQALQAMGFQADSFGDAIAFFAKNIHQLIPGIKVLAAGYKAADESKTLYGLRKDRKQLNDTLKLPMTVTGTTCLERMVVHQERVMASSAATIALEVSKIAVTAIPGGTVPSAILMAVELVAGMTETCNKYYQDANLVFLSREGRDPLEICKHDVRLAAALFMMAGKLELVDDSMFLGDREKYRKQTPLFDNSFNVACKVFSTTTGVENEESLKTRVTKKVKAAAAGVKEKIASAYAQHKQQLEDKKSVEHPEMYGGRI